MTTLITGASSGIGFELAKIFAREGYDLVLVARRRDRLEAVKATIQSVYSIDVQFVVEDLSQEGASQCVVDALAGREIDVLVNNAGSGDYGLFVHTDVAKTSRMLHLNMLTLATLTRLLLPSMIARQSGKILNVASVAAFMPGPTSSMYFASKAFVLSFSEALSNELEGTGVTVTVLCPGATSSEFDTAAGSDWGEAYRKKIPTAQEVAEFGYVALMQGKRLAIHGRLNQFFVFLLRFTPRDIVLKTVRSWIDQ